VNKGIDMSLRVASLDYLGVVAARLRKDAVLSQQKLNTIDQIISEIKAEEQKESEDSNTADKKVVIALICVLKMNMSEVGTPFVQPTE
jgi:cohesin loading factor subunit SCC2